jgi:hypothetical protein
MSLEKVLQFLRILLDIFWSVYTSTPGDNDDPIYRARPVIQEGGMPV